MNKVKVELIDSFPRGSVGNNLLAISGDTGSISGLGRSPGEKNGYPLQYSHLENPVDRADGQAIEHQVANESDTI